MIQKIKKFIVVGIAGFTLMAPAATVGSMSVALAATPNNIQTGLCNGTQIAAGNSANCTNSDAKTSITDIATNIVKIFSVIVGIIAVIMLIYGGFRYITSGGDTNNVASAKNTIIYAIIGLIIVALAQVIVNVVLTTSNKISG